MRRLTLPKEQRGNRWVGIAIAAASGAMVVAGVLLSLWGLGRDDGDKSLQTGTTVIQVSVPQRIELTQQAQAATADGTPLELSGSTAVLLFRTGYLEAIDLPVASPPEETLGSFSDAGTGLHLKRQSDGTTTLRFPLLSAQGDVPVIVTASVKDVQAHEGQTRVSLGQMKADAEFSLSRSSDTVTPVIESVRLEFEIERLPRDAGLKVLLLVGLDTPTLSGIDAALTQTVGPWTAALVLEVRHANLENGTDVGEASLKLTLSSLSLASAARMVAVRLDDEGIAERLASEVAETPGGHITVRFLSPNGLSILAVMVPTRDLEPAPTATALPTSTAAPSATPSATPWPTLSPTLTATVSPLPTATPAKESTSTALPVPTPTRIPTPSPTPTATLTAIPTTTATPLPTPTRSPSPTVTASLSPTGTPTPTPLPSPTQTPTGTPLPSPTFTARPTSTPWPTTPAYTPTPVPVPDEHYAVIVHTPNAARQQWFLDTLSTQWFLDWTDNVDTVPGGHKKLIPIMDLPGPSPQKIQEIAQKAPGSVWYVVGEPNRRSGYKASDIIVQLHDLYAEIRNADPTARITSPSILNWEFTCTGCAGFQMGKAWVEEYRTAYRSLYGTEPPVDIWAIDVYPLDWEHLPTVDSQLAIAQVDGFRQYLNSAGLQGKPIWITELGLHWGWDAMLWPGNEGYDASCNPYPQPTGTYQTQQVIGYLDAVFDWLDANAVSKNIERWFLLSTYDDITRCNSSAYAGLTLFDGSQVGANLTPVGQFFRDRVLGVSP